MKVILHNLSGIVGVNAGNSFLVSKLFQNFIFSPMSFFIISKASALPFASSTGL